MEDRERREEAPIGAGHGEASPGTQRKHRDGRPPGHRGPGAGTGQPRSVRASSRRVNGLTAKHTRPAAGPVERDELDPRRAGQLWERGPFSKGGGQPLGEKNVLEIQRGRVGTRAPASRLFSAPRESVTPHKETPTY